MHFKIDTKEKFTVIRVANIQFGDKLALEVYTFCENLLSGPVKNVILDFGEIESIVTGAVPILKELQNKFVESGASFVVCCCPKAMSSILQSSELNLVPTESEAWDMVQMEEMEREFLKDEG